MRQASDVVEQYLTHGALGPIAPDMVYLLEQALDPLPRQGLSHIAYTAKGNRFSFHKIEALFTAHGIEPNQADREHTKYRLYGADAVRLSHAGIDIYGAKALGRDRSQAGIVRTRDDLIHLLLKSGMEIARSQGKETWFLESTPEKYPLVREYLQSKYELALPALAEALHLGHSDPTPPEAPLIVRPPQVWVEIPEAFHTALALRWEQARKRLKPTLVEQVKNHIGGPRSL